MLEALISGMLAGYGIAIPVGAIAVLIVGVGMKNGFAASASAGAGAATADLLYASVAVVAGGATAAVLERHSEPIRYLSAAVLIVIAIAGLVGSRRAPAVDGSRAVGVERGHLPGVYARFVGLTVINPLTVVYFTTVVIGSGLAADLQPGQGIAFALAAFAASLSWQLLLAGIGSVAGRRLSPRFRIYSAVAGNILILGFALRILLGG